MLAAPVKVKDVKSVASLMLTVVEVPPIIKVSKLVLAAPVASPLAA